MYVKGFMLETGALHSEPASRLSSSNASTQMCQSASYLLALLKFQLNSRLNTVACVLIGLLQGELHEVLVVGSRQVPADENDDVGQDLGAERGHQQGLWGWEH